MSDQDAKPKADGAESLSTAGLGLQRTGRAVMWVGINGAFGALLWFGLVEGVEGARNLGLFLAWANVILSFFMLVPDAQEAMAKKGRSVPKAASVTFDLAVTGLLVWCGAWVTGAAYALHIMLQEAGWESALKVGPTQS